MLKLMDKKIFTILNSKHLSIWTYEFHLRNEFNFLNVHGKVGLFVALCLKSTAMVMAGRSVHLTTLFPGKA